jgi:hypothetical protein
MTIFEEEDRPEIIPLLKAVSEANRSNSDVVTYMHNNLFFDLPIPFVENVLEELRLMGLITEDRILSKRGKQTLEKEEVMVPRTGPYRVDVVNDPLLPQVVINYYPLNASLKMDLFTTEAEPRQIVEIPTFLQNTVGTRIKTLENSSRTIDIKEIQKKGSLLPKTSHIQVILQYKPDYWQLQMKYRKHTRTLDLPQIFDGQRLIDQLLQSISVEADLTRWRIPQVPAVLDIKELSRFKKDFKLSTFEIEELGRFTQVVLEDIEIYPDSDESARHWAIALFLEELSGYMFQERFRNTWTDLIIKYSILSEFTFTPPTLEELWSSVPFGSSKYWFLRAPSDMRLEEVIKL